jgi:hypothetical protein
MVSALLTVLVLVTLAAAGGQGSSLAMRGLPSGVDARPSFTAAMSCSLGYWPKSQ